jgi:hypothetical protein
MWINQPGKAYGPGSKGRVGRNGGAAGGWSVAAPAPPPKASASGWSVVPPPQSSFHQVQPHPVPPGFGFTQIAPNASKLHSLVKNVNLAAAMARVRQLGNRAQAQGLGAARPHPGGAVGGPVGPRPIAGSIADWIAREKALSQDPRIQRSPLGPAPVSYVNPQEAPWIQPTEGPGSYVPDTPSAASLVNPAAPPWQMPQDSQDLVGPYLAQQQAAQAQRAAMVARLVAQGRIQ